MMRGGDSTGGHKKGRQGGTRRKKGRNKPSWCRVACSWKDSVGGNVLQEDELGVNLGEVLPNWGQEEPSFDLSGLEDKRLAAETITWEGGADEDGISTATRIVC